MTNGEADELMATIKEEIKSNIMLQSLAGKRPIVSFTSNQTPDGFLVWVKTKDEGEVFLRAIKNGSAISLCVFNSKWYTSEKGLRLLPLQ